jgi:hypothetical protein
MHFSCTFSSSFYISAMKVISGAEIRMSLPKFLRFRLVDGVLPDAGAEISFLLFNLACLLACPLQEGGWGGGGGTQQNVTFPHQGNFAFSRVKCKRGLNISPPIYFTCDLFLLCKEKKSPEFRCNDLEKKKCKKIKGKNTCLLYCRKFGALTLPPPTHLPAVDREERVREREGRRGHQSS